MEIGWLMSVTTGGSSLTKRLAFLPSESAGGGWCPPCANTSGNAGAKSIMAAKENAITIKEARRRISFLSTRRRIFQKSKSKLHHSIYWLFPVRARARDSKYY